MKLPIFLFVIAALIGSSAYIYAGSQNSTQFRVQIHIKESCNISSEDSSSLDFGTVNRFENNATSQGNLSIHCTNGTPYNITLKSDRQMTNQSALNITIPYTLYQDATRQVIWGESLNEGYNNTGIGSTQHVPVWGEILKQDTNVPSGIYSDTVTATVNY